MPGSTYQAAEKNGFIGYKQKLSNFSQRVKYIKRVCMERVCNGNIEETNIKDKEQNVCL